jgi:paraquat-inducible protein A
LKPHPAPPTLAGHGLRQCQACHLLLRASDAGAARCARCHALLVDTQTPRTRERSLQTTTALLVAAFALYLPSNLMPIMVTRSALGERSDTIMSGVMALLHDGSWPLALIVFVASVLVPLLKLFVLSYLVLAARLGQRDGRHRRTRLYRLIETVGRWSMLDVFVVGVLAALVRLGPAIEVSAGPGVVAFGAVVWLTLWASQSFDPRLIWQTPAVRT